MDMTSSPINSIRDIAAVARGRRLALGLSQADLATRAGVSRQWISGFESGKPGAELGLVIRLLYALDLKLSIEEGADLPPRSVSFDLDAILDEHREP